MLARVYEVGELRVGLVHEETLVDSGFPSPKRRPLWHVIHVITVLLRRCVFWSLPTTSVIAENCNGSLGLTCSCLVPEIGINEVVLSSSTMSTDIYLSA